MDDLRKRIVGPFLAAVSAYGAVAAVGLQANSHLSFDVIALGVLSAVASAISNLATGEVQGDIARKRLKADAERNHLVRRAIAEALGSALLRAKEMPELRQGVAAEMGKALFEFWPEQLKRAESEDAVLDVLVPLEDTECQWEAVMRYAAKLDVAAYAAAPMERVKLDAMNDRDSTALGELLRGFPASQDGPLELLRNRLQEHWTDAEAKAFATLLLPVYRTEFASVIARGGTLTNAVAFKATTETIDRLKGLEDALRGVADEIKEHVTMVSDHSDQVVVAAIHQAKTEILRAVPPLGGGMTTDPGYKYLLPWMDDPVGRQEEREMLAEAWLKDPQRRLLLYGEPGAGKTTLAKWVLRHPLADQAFGERRYELQCDDLTSFDGFLTKMATVWFQMTPDKPEVLVNRLFARLAAEPCAVLIDNFETLIPERDEALRAQSQGWLTRLGAERNVALIVGVQGRVPPADMSWRVRHTPKRLSLEDAVKLFCENSKVPAHADDPWLKELIEEEARVPLAMRLLGGMALDQQNLRSLRKLWEKQGLVAILGEGDGRSRAERLEAAYEFAYRNLSDRMQSSLRVLAWLPSGVAEEDLGDVLPDGLLANSKLYNAAVASREGSPSRLTMVSPLRDYLRIKHPAGEAERGQARDFYLALPTALADLSKPSTGDQIRKILAESANLLYVLDESLRRGQADAVDAARGMARFSCISGSGFAASEAALARACDLTKGDVGHEAWCLFGLGEVARMQSKWSEAQNYYMKAEGIFRKVGQKGGEARCLFGLGEVARLQSKWSEAQSYYTKAEGLFRDVGQKGGEASCQKGLGDVAYLLANTQEEYATAQSYYTKAEGLFRDVGQKGGEAWCLLGLGDLAYMLANTQEECATAQSYYTKAEGLFRDVGQKGGEAWCLLVLGYVARMQSKWSEAQSYYTKAEGLFRDVGEKGGEAWCLWGLGDVAYLLANTQEEYATAQNYYTKALAVFHQVEDERGAAWCVEAISRVELFLR